MLSSKKSFEGLIVPPKLEGVLPSIFLISFFSSPKFSSFVKLIKLLLFSSSSKDTDLSLYFILLIFS